MGVRILTKLPLSTPSSASKKRKSSPTLAIPDSPRYRGLWAQHPCCFNNAWTSPGVYFYGSNFYNNHHALLVGHTRGLASPAGKMRFAQLMLDRPRFDDSNNSYISVLW